MTPKQERFVEEYLVDLNATQAAIRAGYSEQTARQIGAQNLSKLVIQQAIEAARNKRSERVELTQDEVVRDLRELRDICMGSSPPPPLPPQYRKRYCIRHTYFTPS